VLAVLEQAHDRPALGHVADLRERAQVAEEALGLLARVERADGVEERFGVRGLPVVGHRGLPSGIALC